MRTIATRIAAAAMAIGVLAGCQAGAATGGDRSPESTSAAPGAGASPAAATPVYPSWYTPEAGSGGAGILAAGEHATAGFSVPFTFTVPAGWVNDADSGRFFSLFADTPANAAEYAASGGFASGIHMGPMDSPYFFCQAIESNRGSSAAEMVAAVAANDTISTTAVDVTIGGLTGKQVDVQLAPGFAGCPGESPTLDLEDGRVRGLLLDTPDRGVLVIFLSSLHAADHGAFLAAAMPIVEGFQFSVTR